ncbi:ATP-binding protein [Clostridium perfringens]|uniref:VirB4 family type IV secretion system protein n=1 Tax=Clostridium perfringens TaxID=1502 RepID=UPI002245E097|nr:ATP-binding protein [Clostridium perfringens]MCX0355397.1 ATP-binding protein [Clostridium perfringens]
MALFKKEEYNPYLLNKIQPVGGIKFNNRNIVKGDGYEACIRIYDFPSWVNDFWLDNLLDIKDVISTIDIETEDRLKALNDINKSISENQTRMYDLKSNIDIIEASNNVATLQKLVMDMTISDEIIKLITIRYFINARTEQELEKKIKYVLDEIEMRGYRGKVLLNEQEYEWKSLFLSATEQKYLRNKRKGHPIPSATLGAGYPLNFVELNDPYGMFMGTTLTNGVRGNIILDLFAKTQTRKSYNSLVVGTMGAGKSTLLKKVVKNHTIIGNTVRILDVAGEFRSLVLDLGGKIVSLDGSSGIINPLHIYSTIIDENTNEVLIDQSYMQHISKLSIMYQLLAPNSQDDELREFEKLIVTFYKDYGIDREKATEYKAEEYPTLSEFYKYIKDNYFEDDDNVKKNLSRFRQKRIEDIASTIENLIVTYGKIFDGHSSIMDLTKENLISFEVRTLSSMDSKIFNAQMFNVLTMLWNNSLIQGLKEKRAYDEREKKIYEAVKYVLLIDEAHKFINSDNIMGVDFLEKFGREARKYFAGFIFATQSIRDVVPDINNSEVAKKIKTLFELTQYKFIMQQDNNAKEVLDKIFLGQLTQSEVDSIPLLGTGETILSINGDKNLKFKVEISDKEDYLFKGGA